MESFQFIVFCICCPFIFPLFGFVFMVDFVVFLPFAFFFPVDDLSVFDFPAPFFLETFALVFVLLLSASFSSSSSLYLCLVVFVFWISPWIFSELCQVPTAVFWLSSFSSWTAPGLLLDLMFLQMDLTDCSSGDIRT